MSVNVECIGPLAVIMPWLSNKIESIRRPSIWVRIILGEKCQHTMGKNGLEQVCLEVKGLEDLVTNPVLNLLAPLSVSFHIACLQNPSAFSCHALTHLEI